MATKVCVFDAYGTLFDVSAAARRVASENGGESFKKVWESVSANWRLKQLQYTWLRSLAGAHADFWQVTADSLDWSLEAVGLHRDQKLRQQLLALYRELEAYGEVKPMLSKLHEMEMDTAILSNGSPTMLAEAVSAAEISDVITDVISVEDVGVFKPHPSVYELVLKRFDCRPSEVLFVSSNGWDASAASGFGFETVWVNRAQEPHEYLPWKVQHQRSDLQDIPKLVRLPS